MNWRKHSITESSFSSAQCRIDFRALHQKTATGNVIAACSITIYLLAHRPLSSLSSALHIPLIILNTHTRLSSALSSTIFMSDLILSCKWTLNAPIFYHHPNHTHKAPIYTHIIGYMHTSRRAEIKLGLISRAMTPLVQLAKRNTLIPTPSGLQLAPCFTFYYCLCKPVQ